MYASIGHRGAKFEHARNFVRQFQRSLWLCEGVPAVFAYQILMYSEQEGIHVVQGIPNADQAYGENRMFVWPGYENEDGSINEECHQFVGGPYLAAVDWVSSLSLPTP